MPDFTSLSTQALTTFGLNVLAAVAILLIGAWLARLLSGFARHLLVRNQVEQTLVGFAARVVYVAILLFVVIAALSRLGIQTASIVAVIGGAGLALGLALQSSLSNVASGVILILQKPFQIGDFIEAGGAMGTVTDITLLSTTLQSPDNKVIIVPNGSVQSSNIINFNLLDKRRLDLVIGVEYGADIETVKTVLLDEISKEARLLQEPAPTVGLAEMADSSLNFAVRPWVKTEDYWGVFFDFQQSVKNRLDAEGISIPFPQQDVHIVSKA
ncbi:mechanosensitive ion channel [Synechococcus sp. RSCCF101]|uniref:mechanosensitive ion channel family protein n=1 Tax=Synechococcus sp. RSCCF101 TaxID=2511069 RepID=UPI001245A0E2|nr:mechanosensitive ion channel domain-containing protein [Synechococcus sp. RSCCF101]QEY32678.1 mechanosensitive ion channel [Synechococcus sp. RSCCF101]